jgi:uncharacterized glyoxalase superfamily protein PhnB
MDLLVKTFLALVLMSTKACKEENTPGGPGSSGGNEWSISRSEVYDGGPGKDGIPALTTPPMINADEATYLGDTDLVIGYKRGNDVRAYPHSILDWHEIVNDQVSGHPIAIIYCPLTGTGIGWERTLNGTVTTFGVSGLIYNSNIIPYDRLTDSNWSQLRFECVNGELLKQKPETFHAFETTWKTWKEMFPETKVMSTETGFSRNYQLYPYGSYKTSHSSFIFPFDPKDNRVPNKERVLGVIINGKAKVYRFDSFEGEMTLIEDTFEDTDLVIAGSKVHNFLVAFQSMTEDGTELRFNAASFEQGVSSGILTDTEGNIWDISGEAIRGPRVGERLKTTVSFMGYWFSFGAFYPRPEIYE